MSPRFTFSSLLIIVSGALILASCAAQPSHKRATTNGGPPDARTSFDNSATAQNYLQVFEKGRVSVQLRTDNQDNCQRIRQDMLNAAEKASPGSGAKEMAPNLVCSNQPQDLAFALKLQNLDYQFASREACEHYAIVKGLYPPRPAPGTKSPCLPRK